MMQKRCNVYALALANNWYAANDRWKRFMFGKLGHSALSLNIKGAE